jgi:hypothetical protein
MNSARARQLRRIDARQQRRDTRNPTGTERAWGRPGREPYHTKVKDAAGGGGSHVGVAVVAVRPLPHGGTARFRRASERAHVRAVRVRPIDADGRAPAGLSGWPLRVFAISRASASACAPDADVPRDGDDRRVAATQEPHCLPLSSHLALYYLRLGFPYLIRPSVIGRPLVGFHPALFGCWNQPMDRD